MPSNEPSRTVDQSTNFSFPHGANTPKKDVDTEDIGGGADKQRLIEDRQRWQRASSFNRSMNDVSFLNRSRTDFGSSDKVSPICIFVVVVKRQSKYSDSTKENIPLASITSTQQPASVPVTP